MGSLRLYLVFDIYLIVEHLSVGLMLFWWAISED